MAFKRLNRTDRQRFLRSLPLTRGSFAVFPSSESTTMLASASLTALQAEILDQLRPRVTFSLSNFQGVWGPVTSFQYDWDGSTPIQKYVTLLVQLENQDWMLVKRVDDLVNGCVWTRPPFSMPISEQEAKQFLERLGKKTR